MKVATTSCLLLAAVAGGCSAPPATQMSDAERTKLYILRVMKADEQLSKKHKELPPSATPPQMVWAIGQYCDGLEVLYMADCPADFQVAYKQHMRAWREVQAAIKQLPDGFLEGFFMGAVNGVFRGETDGGQSRLEGSVKRAAERVRITWEEVERIGAKYGAAL